MRKFGGLLKNLLQAKKSDILVFLEFMIQNNYNKSTIMLMLNQVLSQIVFMLIITTILKFVNLLKTNKLLIKVSGHSLEILKSPIKLNTLSQKVKLYNNFGINSSPN